MPGIVGIVGQADPAEYQRQIETMIRTLMHEPTYVSGTQLDANLGVYAGWVAHGDSFAARQSTSRSEGQPTLLFSGECFARSEGPVSPLRSYEQRGERFVAELDGSFSGLLIDAARGHALLFNDRFGAERIYYCETDTALYFASEAKALLAVLPQLRRFDEEGVAQFLTYGTTLAERTLFSGIRLMQAGSIWTLSARAAPKKRAYFQPAEWRGLAELPSEQFRERLAETVRSSVSARVGTDAPVGISITGGLDTRMIMACLPQTKFEPVCYTFAGIDGETLDVQIGRRVAAACGLEHRTLRIGTDFLARYGEFVDRTSFITDGYAGALGAHEIYLNALARQIAPVRLTGNFGSEILRGMSTFRLLRLSEDLFEPDWNARLARLRGLERARESHPVMFAAFHEIPAGHFGIPAAARSQVTFRSPFLSNELVELAVRSPAAERSSSAACSTMIERYNPALSQIPTDRGVLPKVHGPQRPWSRLFSEVTFKLDYWHKEGLPASLSSGEPLLRLLSGVGLLGLHKFLPYRGWFRGPLAEYARAVVNDPGTRSMPWWSGRSLDRLVDDHQQGRRNNIHELNAILTLESVHRGLLKATFAVGIDRRSALG